MLILLAIVFRLVMKRTKNFSSGLIGENDRSDELKHLPEGYILLNYGLDTGKGNIDKIVIGPTGVWTLEVKSHSGEISFDGQHLLRNNLPLEKDFLSQAYAEAKTLEEIIKSKTNLSINVQPVLVFSNKFAKVRFGLSKQKGVYVVQKAWLNKLLVETRIQNLDSATILKIKESLLT
jgi:hypothetical protein